MVYAEASTSILKGHSRSGYASTDAFVTFSMSISNPSLQVSVHSNVLPFFVSSTIGRAMPVNPCMNGR
jgi:hypothetical protein